MTMGTIDSFIMPLGARRKVLSGLGMIYCIRAVKTGGFGGKSSVIAA